eukprot:TRINITY_DN5936_c0_g1_i1.p1 TRINITY_DN5936_c0_g1~~TRINITY_DN5936_c0_g1_i1.p1  ORF type:complete len:175 (-),score=27.63 TRINITY_DN5936_c0_g1_i1:53-577(-)
MIKNPIVSRAQGIEEHIIETRACLYKVRPIVQKAKSEGKVNLGFNDLDERLETLTRECEELRRLIKVNGKEKDQESVVINLDLELSHNERQLERVEGEVKMLKAEFNKLKEIRADFKSKNFEDIEIGIIESKPSHDLISRIKDVVHNNQKPLVVRLSALLSILLLVIFTLFVLL